MTPRDPSPQANIEENPVAPPAYDFCGDARVETIAETPGFRVRHVSLSEGQSLKWFRMNHASTTFFACNDGLTIRLKNPPIRWNLRAGETYTVPPHMELTACSENGQPISFVALQYGDSLKADPVEGPSSDFSFGRSMTPRPGIGPRPAASDKELHRYRHGLQRMDILALFPELRVVVQAHGPYECVPFHTHDNVCDTFLAMEGYSLLALKDPDEVIVLAPGESHPVAARRPHFVGGVDGAPCTVMVLQGVGVYNYKAFKADMRGAVENMVLE